MHHLQRKTDYEINARISHQHTKMKMKIHSSSQAVNIRTVFKRLRFEVMIGTEWIGAIKWVRTDKIN